MASSLYREKKLSHESLNQCKVALYTVPEIKYFFEVSLPAIQKQKGRLGHILFVCPDDQFKAYFLRLLQNAYVAKYESRILSTIKRPEDLVSILTNLDSNDVFVCESHSDHITDDLYEKFCTALSSFKIEFVIGKGTTARDIKLDLSEFTFVACFSNATDSTRKLYPLFEHIFKIDHSSLLKSYATRIQNSANSAAVQIEEEACNLIISKAQYDNVQAERYMKRILEYISLQENKINTITSSLVEYVFELSGIALQSSDSSSKEEMSVLFQNLCEMLYSIHNEIHEMHKDINAGLKYLEDAVSAINENLGF